MGGFSPFWTFAVVSKKKKPQGNPTAIGEIPVFLWHPWRHPRPDMRLDHLPGRRRHPHRDLDHLAEAPGQKHAAPPRTAGQKGVAGGPAQNLTAVPWKSSQAEMEDLDPVTEAF